MDDNTIQIQIRRDTTENWLKNKDVIPAAGEPCFDLDTGTLKIGDGVTSYENLKVIGNGDGSATPVDLSAYRTASAQDEIDEAKQDKLSAGENITIDENVISAKSVEPDGKTILIGDDGKLKTQIGGYPTIGFQTICESDALDLAEEESLGEAEKYGKYLGILDYTSTEIGLLAGSICTVVYQGSEYSVKLEQEIVATEENSYEEFILSFTDNDAQINILLGMDAVAVFSTVGPSTVSVKISGDVITKYNPISDKYISDNIARSETTQLADALYYYNNYDIRTYPSFSVLYSLFAKAFTKVIVFDWDIGDVSTAVKIKMGNATLTKIADIPDEIKNAISPLNIYGYYTGETVTGYDSYPLIQPMDLAGRAFCCRSPANRDTGSIFGAVCFEKVYCSIPYVSGYIHNAPYVTFGDYTGKRDPGIYAVLSDKDTKVHAEFLVPAFDNLVVPSSTEGSTKNFKITVDDNGAISATEVTI